MQGLLNNKKWKIIKEILSNAGSGIKVRETARKLNVSAGLVTGTIKKLKKIKVIRREGVDLNNPLTRSMKIMINTEKLLSVVQIISENLDIKGMGVYGSWANGTNDGKSDVDFWIKVDKYPEAIKIAKLRAVLRKRIKIKPSFMFLTDEKIKKMKDSDEVLYFALIYSMCLRGERID